MSERRADIAACKSVLAELEKASGADIWLDRAVSVALDQPWDWSVDWRGWGYNEAGKTIEQEKAFPYTSSLDAAIALVERVLPSWAWSVFDDGHAWLWPDQKRDLLDGFQARVATPPLALLTALFKALIAQMEAEHAD